MAIDWGASGRTDTYQFFRVDPFTLAEIDEIDGDPASTSITWAYDTENIASATISIANDVANDCMIRIKQIITCQGETSTRTLGTFFPETNGTASTYGLAKRGFNGYSALWRHSKDYLVQSHAYKPGDNCVNIIREIVEADGGQLYVIDGAPIDRTHTRDVFWNIGTNKLEMINTIAGWIGAEIGVTPDGQVSVGAYLDPWQRPISWTFEAGKNCVYLPGITWTDNRDDAINRVIAYFSRETKGETDNLPLSDQCFVSLDPGHPYSFQRLGRNRSYVMQSEPVTHDELVTMATDYLNANCGNQVCLEIQHVGIPGMQVGQVVRYINPSDYVEPVDVRCLVMEMAVSSLSQGCITKTKLRVLS